MYYYVYDEFVQDSKLEKELQKIENRLTDLGIQGKIGRLALFKDADELVRDEVARGVKTIVAVGDDETVKKVINAVTETGVVLGHIPLGEKNNLAGMCGIPVGVGACDVLSRRMIKKLDTALINKRRFIFGVNFPKIKAMVDCGKFSISSVDDGEIEVRNLMPDEQGGVSDPRDGSLDIVVKTSVGSGFLFGGKEAETGITLNKFIISTVEPVVVMVDGEEMENDKIKISVEKGFLQMVVVREMLF